MHLDKLRNHKGEVWLNVASSHYVLDGFINLDNNALLIAMEYPILCSIVPRKNRELLDKYKAARNIALLVRHDCRRPLPVRDESVDHILCSHFLEHVYPDEAAEILKDFGRALKPGATMHIIVPDLEAQIRTYTEGRRDGFLTAADDFVRGTLLTRSSRGSFLYRALEFVGSFGLQHRWMYDRESMKVLIEKLGFSILETNDTPSHTYRQQDDSVHIIARKVK